MLPHWLHIINPDLEHLDEICKDIRVLYKKGVIDCPVFSCTLVPEGNPALDKGTEYRKHLREFHRRLTADGLPFGILLQATIGHGWTPSAPAGFDRIVTSDGASPYMFCQLDENFRNYLCGAVRILALEKPDFMMLDDDFRMITGRGGCFCERHIAEFSHRCKKQYTRETLVKEISENPETARAYDAWQMESLLDLAKDIRGSLDSVDPAIPCSFCCCSQDVRHAIPIAKVLAGNGPVEVRINNARYNNDSPRSFAPWLNFTATQIAAFPEEYTLLCEPDTCPQNRYSTSSAVMRAQLTLSLMLGCRGGKIWISRLSVWEPASGLHYRKTLMRDMAFLHALENMRIHWTAPAVPLPQTPVFNYPSPPPSDRWGGLFACLGLPVCFSRNPESSVLLCDASVAMFGDDELKHFLSGPVLVDGTGVRALVQRGFADLIGLDSSAGILDSRVSYEKDEFGRIGVSGGSFADLRKTDRAAKILSTLCFSVSKISHDSKEIGTGSYFFRNKLGGKIAALSMDLRSEGGITNFGYLHERRKKQLVRLLELIQGVDLYFPGDTELILMIGHESGKRFFSATNLSLDPLNRLVFCGKWASVPAPVEFLAPNGEWKTLAPQFKDGAMTLKVALNTLETGVFRMG